MPLAIAEEKLKSKVMNLTKMVKNWDIVAGWRQLRLIGLCRRFAAETNNNGRIRREAKRARKIFDLICANDVSQPDQGFNSDSNALHLFWQQDGDKRLPLERARTLANYYRRDRDPL